MATYDGDDDDGDDGDDGDVTEKSCCEHDEENSNFVFWASKIKREKQGIYAGLAPPCLRCQFVEGVRLARVYVEYVRSTRTSFPRLRDHRFGDVFGNAPLAVLLHLLLLFLPSVCLCLLPSGDCMPTNAPLGGRHPLR